MRFGLALASLAAFVMTSGAANASQSSPAYGSPNTLQFQNAAVSLDLFDVEPEANDPSGYQGDSDEIGAGFTYGKIDLQHDERYDFTYHHARRLKEGSRARLLIDVPVSIYHGDSYTLDPGIPGIPPFTIPGATAVYGGINVGVEVPVTPNFYVTPRVSYDNAQAGPSMGNDAELVNASVTTRYRLPQVGRGEVVFGGMAAYSHTVHTFLGHQPFFQNLGFWTLRGGVAYQLPLKQRMFGRQSSLRMSYVFTYMTGVPFEAYKQVHEVGISIGVRTREIEQKNKFEQLRIGLLYTHAVSQFAFQGNSNTGSLFVGYRF